MEKAGQKASISEEYLVTSLHCDEEGEREASITEDTFTMMGSRGTCLSARENTAEYPDRVKRGQAARLRRVQSGLSLHEEAARIGVSAQRLRYFEWGTEVDEETAAKIIAAQFSLPML